jgi:hypothetical protein
MTVSSVAPEEIVTIILRLLVDGTEVFRSSYQYLVALRYLMRDLREVSILQMMRKVANRITRIRTRCRRRNSRLRLPSGKADLRTDSRAVILHNGGIAPGSFDDHRSGTVVPAVSN